VTPVVLLLALGATAWHASSPTPASGPWP
jgi:hypothetical protein